MSDDPVRLKPWPEAVADVQRLGIALRNLSVDLGDPEDHGIAEDDEDARLAFDLGEHPSPRRWAFVETDAGLAEDDAGKIVSYREAIAPHGPLGANLLKVAGWEYMGSGSYRVEVDPATVPPTTEEPPR